MRKGIGGVHRAECSIAVTTGTFEGHAITQRAGATGGDAAWASPFQREEAANVVLVFAFGEQIADTAQIARTFLAHGADEQDVALGLDTRLCHGPCEGQNRRCTCLVVT